eukprot:m.12923 g.12923  ORF g.12923 m.12923 type:complete len:1524 (-) comp2993_c0_seq1:30-4601(-)
MAGAQGMAVAPPMRYHRTARHASILALLSTAAAVGHATRITSSSTHEDTVNARWSTSTGERVPLQSAHQQDGALGGRGAWAHATASVGGASSILMDRGHHREEEGVLNVPVGEDERRVQAQSASQVMQHVQQVAAARGVSLASPDDDSIDDDGDVIVPKPSGPPSLQMNAYVATQPRRASPAARVEHAMASGPNGTIILFGGRMNDNGDDVSPSTFADTWIYLNGDTIWQEQQVGPGGNHPVGRSGHTLVPAQVERSSFFMFGGLVNDDDGLVVKNDLWVLSVDLKSSATWSQLFGENKKGMAWPTERAQHAAVLIDNATLIVTGGVHLMWTQRDCDPNTVVTEDSMGCWAPSDENSTTLWAGAMDNNSVWQWTKRQQKDPAKRPPQLSEHSMVVFNNTLYVYGGRRWSPVVNPGTGEILEYTATVSSELWALDVSTGLTNDAWVNLTDTGMGWIPQGRYEHSVVVLGSGDDAEMHVLYGRVGEDDYPEYPTVAYSFSKGTWRNATTLNESVYTEQERPITRGGQAAAAFDTSTDGSGADAGSASALMFGGECHLTNHLGLPFRDTWNYTLDPTSTESQYTFVSIAITDYPVNLLSHRAVMIEGRMCMFGGLNLQAGFNRNLFCLSYNESITADSANADSTGSLFAWRHKPASIADNFDNAIPSGRADFAAAEVSLYDAPTNSTYAFYFVWGGRNHYAISIDATPLSDTWVYSMRHFAWTQAQQINAPDPRMAQSCVSFRPDAATYHGQGNPPKNAVVMFGGVKGVADVYGTELTNELWVGNLSSKVVDANAPPQVMEVWTQLDETDDTPPPVAWHTAVALDNLMVVFGGRSTLDKTLNATNQVYVFNMTASLWMTNVNVSGQGRPGSGSNLPNPRYGHAAAALSARRMVVVGGFSIGGVLGDVWVLTLEQGLHGEMMARWEEIVEQKDPNFPTLSFVRGYHSLVFDPRSKSLVIFGGTSLQLSDQNDYGTTFTFQAGCNAGQYSSSFARIKCSPCPIGTYSEGPGYYQCQTCPAETTTPLVGSYDRSNCSVCVPGTCHGRGTCTVKSDLSVECQCGLLYGGIGHRCENIAWYWVLGFTLAIIVPLLYLMLVYIRRYRRAARTLTKENEQSARVLRDLVNVWQIDPHEIMYDRSIGEGQYGSVWAARYKSMQVAVKKLRYASVPPQFYKELIDSFEQEGSLLLRLNHRNIIHFFGAGYEKDGETRGNPFLVTELAQKGSLAAVLANKGISLSWKERINAALDAASGMAYLHEREIVHRDLKSFNLLVAHDLTVKVADFGTSVIMQCIQRAETGDGGLNTRNSRAFSLTSLSSLSRSGDVPTSRRNNSLAALSIPETSAGSINQSGSGTVMSPLTNMGQSATEVSPLLMSANAVRVRGTVGDMFSTVGTTEWMAPEVLEARDIGDENVAKVSGPEIDVYSFGIVMWEICSRKLPWDNVVPGPLGINIKKLVVAGSRPPIPDTVPPRYSLLMQHCWDSDPKTRPSFAVVVHRLSDIQANRSSNAGMLSPVRYRSDSETSTFLPIN